MITKHNLQAILDLLTEEEITNAVEAPGDYINLTVDGYGQRAGIESAEQPDQDLIDMGFISADKDDFLRLCEEANRLPEYYK